MTAVVQKTQGNSLDDTNELLLDMRDIGISFPGVKALNNVNFQVKRGEIHALMGENGAGKSTMIKVLTGVHRRDSGEIIFEGKKIDPHSTHEAQALGISTVYQEVNLIPHLSVAENILLGRQPMRFGQINWKELNHRAEHALARLNLRLDVTQPLISYSIAIQQMVAIARAVAISARLLILDEPTSSLSEHEVLQLFTIMRKLKADGMGIVFITHFLDQVYQITDRITVLRNGVLVGNFVTAALTKVELISAMVGKDKADLDKTSKDKGGIGREHLQEKKLDIFLKVKNFSKKGALNSCDADFIAGEVIGLAGLLGSGRTEFAKLIFGIERVDKGQTVLDGKPVTINSPQEAINKGFGFCPEDRKAEGIIADLTVRENIILALQAKHGWLHSINRKKQESIAERYIKDLNIATPNIEQPIKTLSGGNQQKVILARWLASNPRFLILDEPTRGIDVGAKAEIQKIISELSRQGMTIMFISSELEEVVRCSRRVIVLRDRNKVGELVDNQINEEEIVRTIAEGGET